MSALARGGGLDWRTMRRDAHHLIRLLAAVGLGAVPLGCGSIVSLEDTGDETGTTGASGDDDPDGTGSSEPGPDAPEPDAPGEPFAGLPNAAAFGMSFDPDSPTMQPQTLRIDAPIPGCRCAGCDEIRRSSFSTRQVDRHTSTARW